MCVYGAGYSKQDSGRMCQAKSMTVGGRSTDTKENALGACPLVCALVCM